MCDLSFMQLPAGIREMYWFSAAQLATCILLGSIFCLLQKHRCMAATRPQGYHNPKRRKGTFLRAGVFGGQHTSPVEAARFGARLWCLYTSAHSLQNKQEESEAHVLLRSWPHWDYRDRQYLLWLECFNQWIEAFWKRQGRKPKNAGYKPAVHQHERSGWRCDGQEPLLLHQTRDCGV